MRIRLPDFRGWFPCKCADDVSEEHRKAVEFVSIAELECKELEVLNVLLSDKSKGNCCRIFPDVK